MYSLCKAWNIIKCNIQPAKPANWMNREARLVPMGTAHPSQGSCQSWLRRSQTEETLGMGAQHTGKHRELSYGELLAWEDRKQQSCPEECKQAHNKLLANIDIGSIILERGWKQSIFGSEAYIRRKATQFGNLRSWADRWRKHLGHGRS